MRKIGRILLKGMICIGTIILLSSCGKVENSQSEETVNNQLSDLDNDSKIKSSEFGEDVKNIVIPGIEKSYKLLVINDMHIVEESDTIPDKREEIKGRLDLFVDSEGRSSAESWTILSNQIDSYNADAVLLAGDMVDFYSPENLDCLKQGLNKINTSFIYLRADHDYGTWYYKEDKAVVKEKEEEIGDDQEILIKEFPDFMVVGINNSTSQMSEEGIRRLEEIWKISKPVILLTHVPLNSRIDNGLSEESKLYWGDRALLWGEECYYEPDENTSKFIDMVLQEDSPVVAVLSAHLHFPYTVNLNDSVVEYVFDASYKNTIGIVNITDE